MNIHLIVWWKVKVLVCQGVSAISPTPILSTYYHSEAGPYNSEAGPYHSEAGPYYSEAGPYTYTQRQDLTTQRRRCLIHNTG